MNQAAHWDPKTLGKWLPSLIVGLLYGVISPSWVIIWLPDGTKVCSYNCRRLTNVNSNNKSSNVCCCKFWGIIVQILNHIQIFYLLKEFLCLLNSAKCCLIVSPISPIFSQMCLNCGSSSCTAIIVRKKKNVFQFNTETAGTLPPCFLPLGCLAAALTHAHSIPRCFNSTSADNYQQYISKYK